MNRWNNGKWAQVNQKWLIERDYQHLWKVNDWCGVLNETIIGPFYLLSDCNFLRNMLDGLMENIPLQQIANMHCQQDGCPAHTPTISRERKVPQQMDW